jgi:hypothetical protein
MFQYINIVFPSKVANYNKVTIISEFSSEFRGMRGKSMFQYISIVFPSKVANYNKVTIPVIPLNFPQNSEE